MKPHTRHPRSDRQPPRHGPDSRRRRPRFLFMRFATLFGFMALMIFGGMGAIAFLLTRVLQGDGQTAVLVWVSGCSLSLALPSLAIALAVRAWRGIATPLADVMTAADAVAEGDLSVRVPEKRPAEFGQLARSFNRMAAELERAEQQRRNLTSDVAHELRTPLHIIQGNLEGILDGVYDPTPGHIADTLEETHLLARLVEDLRTLSLAEAGQLPLRQEPVCIAALLADVQTSFSGPAEMAGITLTVEMEAGVETAVLGDADRLEQVLGNLISNSLRHSPAGSDISLRAGLDGEMVRLQIADQGEGIAPDALPFVFDRFWRGDRARSDGDGSNSGLGLTIAQQLIVAHNGRISVASELGTGTTFTIELPRLA